MDGIRQFAADQMAAMVCLILVFCVLKLLWFKFLMVFFVFRVCSIGEEIQGLARRGLGLGAGWYSH